MPILKQPFRLMHTTAFYTTKYKNLNQLARFTTIYYNNRYNLTIPYYIQLSEPGSFVWASLNAGLYLGNWDISSIGELSDKEIYDGLKIYNYLSNNNVKVLKHFELDKNIISTEKIQDVIKFGGIINVCHPIYKLHYMFIEPEINGRCLAVNSLLGPDCFELGVCRIKKLLPKLIDRKCYHLN